MRQTTFAVAALLLSGSFAVAAPRISGEYIESRTCDVYTGPCFANGEMDLAGKKALMAWQVDDGEWNGVRLDGLGAALVVRAEGTLGEDDVFSMKPGRVRGVILVDETASDAQRDALVDFVRDSAGDLAREIVAVDRVPFVLKNDHVRSVGRLEIGDVARIETRALKDGDCVCSNEIVFYNPLVEVQNAHPAFTESFRFRGEGLGTKFETRSTRSTFMATFRR